MCNHLVIIVQSIPDQVIQCPIYTGPGHIVSNLYRTMPYSVQSIPDQAIKCPIYTGPSHIVFKCIPDQSIQCSSAYRTRPFGVQSIPDQAIQCPIYTGPGHIVFNLYRTRPYSVQSIPVPVFKGKQLCINCFGYFTKSASFVLYVGICRKTKNTSHIHLIVAEVQMRV